MLLRVVFFSALLSLTILAFSSALEVGDIATDSAISKEAKIKLSDFPDKLILLTIFTTKLPESMTGLETLEAFTGRIRKVWLSSA